MDKKARQDFEKTLTDQDFGQLQQVLNSENVRFTEVYLRMPTLTIQGNKSVHSLEVFVYSEETSNEVLLHTLFSKVRDRAETQ